MAKVNSVDELNEFYAWVMFYGREALELVRGRDPQRIRFVAHLFRDRTFWIPGMGVLAEFSIAGKILSDLAGRKLDVGIEKPSNHKRTQNLFWKQLSGTNAFDKRTLETLSLGLVFPEKDRKEFVEIDPSTSQCQQTGPSSLAAYARQHLFRH